MSADISIVYFLTAEGKGTGQRTVQTFVDWYAVADWLKQHNEEGRVVCVQDWRYVHARRVET
jgi:hypothetical protein